MGGGARRALRLRLLQWETCPAASSVWDSATQMHLGAADACCRMDYTQMAGTEEVILANTSVHLLLLLLLALDQV